MDLITLALARSYTDRKLSGVNEAVEDAQQAVIDAQTAVGQAQSTLQQIQNVADNIPDDYEYLSQTVQSMSQWGNQISKQTRNLIYDIIPGLDIDSTGKAVSSQQYALALCFVDDGGTYTVTVPDDQVVYGYFSNIPVADMYTTDATRYTLPAGVTTITSSYTRLLAVRFTMGASATPPQIEEGTEQTRYIQPLTAIDAEAREDIEDLQGSLGSIEEIRQDVESMSSNFNVITTAIEPTRNLASFTIRNAKIDDNGIIVATDEPYKISICYLPRSQTTYSVSLSGDSAWAYNTFIYGICEANPETGTVEIGSQVVSVSDTQQTPAVITLDNLQQFNVPFLVVQANISVKVQIERGSQHTQYIDPISAKDVIVRESLPEVREYAISNIRVTTDTEPNHTGLGIGTHTVTIYPFEEYTFGRPHYATGINLFDVSDADSVTLNGVTVTPLSNNAFLLNGTATGTDLADFTCITKSLDDAPGVGERLQLCTYNNDQTIRITLSTVSDSGSISELHSINSSASSALVTSKLTNGIPEGTAGLNIKFITTSGTVFDNAVVWIGVYHQTTQFTSVLNGQLPVTFESGLDTISTLYYPSVVSDVKNAQEYIDTNIDDTVEYINDQIENVDNNIGELREDISDVKNDLNVLATDAYVPVSYALKPNTYIDRSGNDYHYNGWTATSHIPVTAGEKLYLYNSKLTEYCAFYKDDDTLLARATVGVGEPFALNIPDGANYFAYSNETENMFTRIYRDAGITSLFASVDSVGAIGEPVNGNVSYELEQGNVAFTDHGWFYSDMSTRIRVREGTAINLPKGTVITLADFASYHMYIGWMKDGTYGYSGWMENTFVCPETAEYAFVITKKPETDISVNEAEQQLSIYAYNSLVYDKYENSLKGLWKNEWLYDVAHRGYVRGGAPADTAPAYIQAKVQGYNAIEGDIRVTSDGKYVIHHDDGMPSDSTYKISEHTLAELQANANMGTYKGQAVPILTLREMLVIAKNIDVTVFLELKSDLTNSQIVEVMTIARDCGMQDRIRWIAKTSNASVFRGFYALCYLAIFNTLDYALIQPLVISGHPERTFVYTMSTNITETLVTNCANVGLGVVGWCVSYDWMFPDGWTDTIVKSEIVRALDCGAQGMALDWWTVSKIIEETYQVFI